MNDVSARSNDGGRAESPSHDEDDLTVEAYETDGGVVFYDSDNPLAWVETCSPIHLEDVA
ncbi:MAG: hypothetical protein U5K37_01695 [Natrialbaceae archaeon]|nr:hypothetical protein [Natrialbaceae archaeon]